MKRLGEKFLFANCAAAALEYGLIAALVAVAVAAGGYAAGSSIQTAFRQVTDNMATGSIKKSGGGLESAHGLRSGARPEEE
jgi:Flp pilus assembly pilin Flp